jgi:hypothetical protein
VYVLQHGVTVYPGFERRVLTGIYTRIWSDAFDVIVAVEADVQDVLFRQV